MGLTLSTVYGGGGPLGSPTPSPVAADGDVMGDKGLSPVHIAVAAIILLVVIRVIYEMAS